MLSRPIFSYSSACTASPSSRSRLRPPRNRPSAPSRSCFFHWLIWTGWTWYALASSATVLVCLAASRATLALKAAGWRLRVPAMMHLGMDQRSSISITSRAVQFQGSTSVIGAMYEQLIRPEERHRYGQHYTQPQVVDLINAFVILD